MTRSPQPSSTAAATSTERGSAAVELVVLTPLLVAVLLFVVLAGRVSGADLEVRTVAADAARAGSRARTPDAAVAVAGRTAARQLTGAGPQCRTWSVRTDVTRFGPGGRVRVTVSCTISLADLSGLRLPGSKTVTAAALSPVDRYRATR